MPLGNRADIRFGPLLIKPSRLGLEGPRGTQRVEPRVMTVLLALHDAAGEVVTRDELHELCWKGVIVGEDSINRAVAELRRALRSVTEDVEVETIPRIGYRLSNPDADALAQAVPLRPSRRAIIAGATAIVGLGGLGALKFWQSDREQARALVTEARDKLRLDQPKETAAAIGLLQQSLELDETSATAWGMLAHANALPDQFDATLAERSARRALAIDPAQPLALLAQAMLRAQVSDWLTIERTLQDILKTAPEMVEAMDVLAFLQQGVGRVHDSLEWIERTTTIDPLYVSGQYKRALKFWILGRVQEADRVIDGAMQIWPRHSWVWNARLMIYMFTGRAGAARGMLARTEDHPELIAPPAITTWQTGLTALERRDPASIANARNAYFESAARSPGMSAHGIMTLSQLGDLDGAHALIDMLLFNEGPLARPAPKEASERLLSDNDWRQTQWLFTPPLAALRKDPRFAVLCDRIGLTDYWAKLGKGPDPLP